MDIVISTSCYVGTIHIDECISHVLT